MLIGICGKMQSGKDTVGDILTHYLIENGYDPECFAFADEVKKMTSTFLECNVEDLYDVNFKSAIVKDFTKVTDLRDGCIKRVVKSDRITYKHSYLKTYKPVTYREVLQYVGQKIRDLFGENYWVNNLFNNPYFKERMYDKETNVNIITDVRYLNEASAIIDRGGIIIKVLRETGIESSHPSETESDLITGTYVIDNNGTLVDLYSKVSDIVSELIEIDDSTQE